MPEETVHKLVYFSRKTITDIHTYIHTYKHNLRLRPDKRPPRLHDYVPHAKAFGNNATRLSLVQLFNVASLLGMRLHEK